MEKFEFNKSDVIKIAEEIKSIDELAKKRAPYQFNILDCVPAHENAHSKVLINLLGFRSGGKYPILESFLRYLEFDDRIISHLAEAKFDINDGSKLGLTQEKMRIDGLIVDERDRSFAIIIENKIYGASDQDRQIERYFNDVIKANQIKANDIYVLYLTKEEGVHPSESSLPAVKQKELFESGRYQSVSYRKILSWLKDIVLPGCHYRDYLLISGLIQYVNYLKGFYNIRDKKTEEVKENIITKKLKIQGDNIFNTQKSISEKLIYIKELQKEKDANENFDNVQELLETILERNVLEIFSQWQDLTNTELEKFWITEKDNLKGRISEKMPYSGVESNYAGVPFLCAIGMDSITDDQAYYGLTIRGCSGSKSDNVEFMKFVSDVKKNQDLSVSGRWYCYKSVSLEKVHNDFLKFAEFIKGRIKST